MKAIGLIDERVAPYLGRATTRALVQSAAKRTRDTYPFLACFVNRPYTDIAPSVLHEYLAGVSTQELAQGFGSLIDECFAGLRELTGELIVPSLHNQIIEQLGQEPKHP
jgi:hypothetical protein